MQEEKFTDSGFEKNMKTLPPNIYLQSFNYIHDSSIE